MGKVRADRSRLGLFASYPVGVKINVNFAVELISPSTYKSHQLRRFSPSLSLFLSIFFPLYTCLVRSTGAPLRTFPLRPTLSRPSEPSLSFPKLENFCGEKKHRVSAVFSARSSRIERPFGSFPAGIRATFCRDFLRRIVFLL